jgi:hypothetical protein
MGSDYKSLVANDSSIGVKLTLFAVNVATAGPRKDVASVAGQRLNEGIYVL